MQKPFLKYSIILILLPVYINRSFFITPYENENCGNNETNTVIELAVQLVTGENNDIDEDGDLQNDCHSAKTVSNGFYQHFAQYLEPLNLYSNTEKITFSSTENFYLKDFYTQIDHPPQAV